jgi:multicomponent Na+:H+ antiporter subunit C
LNRHSFILSREARLLHPLLLALAVVVLLGTGTYCLMRRCLMRIVIGLILISQGANLLVFFAGGLSHGSPAFVPAGATAPPPGAADPLPQSLVLTAIVIGFWLTVFALTLLHRAQRATGHDDIDGFNRTDAL